ncbi:MAG: hypothetical protein H7Z16_19580 [Pyrinomonadaceae bacterium]|nr:hypothetical protein [Pyrinomonadaceae bacterium]
MNDQPKNSADDKVATKYQDSSKLAIDISKQFLTLAIAGIGFVIGMLISEPPRLPTIYLYWALIPLLVSVGLALLFLMGVVSQISRRNNYDIYSIKPRALAVLQILFFVGAIVALGVATINITRSNSATHDPSILEVKFGEHHVKRTVSVPSDVTVQITSDNQLSVAVVPK